MGAATERDMDALRLSDIDLMYTYNSVVNIYTVEWDVRIASMNVIYDCNLFVATQISSFITTTTSTIDLESPNPAGRPWPLYIHVLLRSISIVG